MEPRKAYDPEALAAQGWRRQSVVSEPRLSEAVELYQSLGQEVLLVPLLREQGAGCAETCTACFDADGDPDRFQVIYTRPRPDAETGS